MRLQNATLAPHQRTRSAQRSVHGAATPQPRTILSSSRPDPNRDSTFFTAGGGPCCLPPGAITKPPTCVRACGRESWMAAAVVGGGSRRLAWRCVRPVPASGRRPAAAHLCAAHELQRALKHEPQRHALDARPQPLDLRAAARASTHTKTEGPCTPRSTQQRGCGAGRRAAAAKRMRRRPHLVKVEQQRAEEAVRALQGRSHAVPLGPGLQDVTVTEHLRARTRTRQSAAGGGHQQWRARKAP